MERGDGDDDPLLSVPDRDAKEKTLIMERGDGTRPGASDEDDPPPLGPRQGCEGDIMGSQDALKRGRWARVGPEKTT